MSTKQKTKVLIVLAGLAFAGCAQQAFIKKPTDIVREVQRAAQQDIEVDQGTLNPTEPRADFTEADQNYFKGP